MAGVQGSALTVAVSNAGGLGSLPCAMLSLEAIRNELTAIRAQTDRPFNLNFFCHTPPLPNDAREARLARRAGALLRASTASTPAPHPGRARAHAIQRRGGRPDRASSGPRS